MEMTRQCIIDKPIAIRSAGRLPNAPAVEIANGPCLSRLRNPLITDAFHRTGAVEFWHRYTNGVIDRCPRYGVDPPTFSEEARSLMVTFRDSTHWSSWPRPVTTGRMIQIVKEFHQGQFVAIASRQSGAPLSFGVSDMR